MTKCFMKGKVYRIADKTASQQQKPFAYIDTEEQSPRERGLNEVLVGKISLNICWISETIKKNWCQGSPFRLTG